MKNFVSIIAVIVVSIFIVSCQQEESSNIEMPKMEFSINSIEANQTYLLKDIVENFNPHLIQGFRYDVIDLETQERLNEKSEYAYTFQEDETELVENFEFSVDGQYIKKAYNVNLSQVEINLQIHQANSNQKWIELASKTIPLDYVSNDDNDTDTTDIWPDSAPWNKLIDTIYYDKTYIMFAGDRGLRDDQLFEKDDLLRQQIDYEQGDVKMIVSDESGNMVYWDGIWENAEQNMNHLFKINDQVISQSSQYTVEIEVTLHQGGTHVDSKTFPLGFK